MALFDIIDELADNQLITSSAESDYYIDMNQTTPQFGANPKPLYVNVKARGTWATGTSLTIGIQTSSDNGAVDTYADVASSPAILTATINSQISSNQGWLWRIPLPVECKEMYVRLYFTVAGSPYDNGTERIDAWLGGPADTNKSTQVMTSPVGMPT